MLTAAGQVEASEAAGSLWKGGKVKMLQFVSVPEPVE